jgi:hypothetical protein
MFVHFWERAMSRRQVIKMAAGATGIVLGAGVFFPAALQGKRKAAKLRLHVVYDDRGMILTAAQVPAEDLALPEEPGERAAEFDVPAEFAGGDLRELTQRLRVDVRENRLIERR